MTTRWTFRPAQVWAALFTAVGPEDYADYADCDADPRRVRREPAAIRVRFPHIRFHMPAPADLIERTSQRADLWPRGPINDQSDGDMNFALLASFRQRGKRWRSGWRK